MHAAGDEFCDCGHDQRITIAGKSGSRAYSVAPPLGKAKSQQRVKVLFPSQVQKVDPQLSWAECLRLADQFNTSTDKNEFLMVTTGEKSSGSSRTPLVHMAIVFLSIFFTVFLPMYVLLGNTAFSFLVGALNAWLLGSLYGALYHKLSTKRIAVTPTIGVGAHSRKAMSILNFEGIETLLDMSKDEIYQRLEFLSKYSSTKAELTLAMNKLRGTDHEAQAVEVLDKFTETFKQNVAWLEDAESKVNQVRTDHHRLEQEAIQSREQQDALEKVQQIRQSDWA